MQERQSVAGTVAVVHFFLNALMESHYKISLGNNSEYTIDVDGLIHLDEALLQAAVAREVYFLLHPADEKTLAAKTLHRLKQAFDARIVGPQLAFILSEAGRLA